MSHIFISHSSKDDLATDRLADVLKKAGLNVWVDHHKLDTSVPNWEKIIREQSLPTSSAVIFLMSENSLDSKICEAECLLAQELGLTIHVVELEKVATTRVWLPIKLNHRAKLYENYDLELTKLIAVLQTTFPIAIPIQTVVKRTGEDVMRNTLGYSTDEVRLVGREKDIEAIEKLIGKYVLQVYAVGGTGKSRIAAEIAVNYPTGMIWHRCSENSHPSELLDLIRQHYQLPKEMLETDILVKLEQNPPLIVVDNAEVIVVDTDQRKAHTEMLGKIRHHTPILLTTRVIWSELTPNKSYSVEALSDTSIAVNLTQEFAKAEDVVYTDEQATALAKAARLHPGLIKLAVRFKLLPFDVVLARLNELKHRDFEEAINQMIRSTVQQMESQDKDGEQASAWLKRLTVFRGGFTFEAALAVGPEDIDADALYDALATLRLWGFVRQNQEIKRYYIDDIVIAANPTDEATQQLHFDYFFKLHGNEEVNLNEDRHNLISQDWLNLQKAFEWGWDNNPLLAIGLVVALNYYAQIRLSILSQESLYKIALEVAIKNNFLLPQGHCQILLTNVYRMKSEHGLAFQTAQAALAIAEREKDVILKCQAFWSLGDISQHQNQYENAKFFFEQALSEYNTVPSINIGKGNVLESLGKLARIDDEYEKAERYYLAALDVSNTEIAKLSRANVLAGLGDISRLKNAFQISEEYYYEALNLFRSIGYVQGIGNILVALGDLSRTQNYYNLAIDYYLQALQAYYETGEQLGIANTKAGLADAISSIGNPEQSKQLYREAEIIFTKVSNDLGLGNVYLGLAYISGRQGYYEMTIPLFERAFNYFKQASDRRGQLNALDGLGTSYELLGKFTLACEHYKELLELQGKYSFIGDSARINAIHTWCKNHCGD